MKGAEDRVGLVRLSPDGRQVVDRVQAGMGPRLHACRLQRAPHARHAPPGERARVGAEVDLAGVDLAGEVHQFPLRRPAAYDQVAVQALAQLGQALEHELRAWAGGVSAGQQTIVEAEDTHHALAAIERRAKRRMVVQAQIAREPDDARHSGEYGAG